MLLNALGLHAMTDLDHVFLSKYGAYHIFTHVFLNVTFKVCQINKYHHTIMTNLLTLIHRDGNLHIFKKLTMKVIFTNGPILRQLITMKVIFNNLTNFRVAKKTCV